MTAQTDRTLSLNAMYDACIVSNLDALPQINALFADPDGRGKNSLLNAIIAHANAPFLEAFFKENEGLLMEARLTNINDSWFVYSTQQAQIYLASMLEKAVRRALEEGVILGHVFPTMLLRTNVACAIAAAGWNPSPELNAGLTFEDSHYLVAAYEEGLKIDRLGKIFLMEDLLKGFLPKAR